MEAWRAIGLKTFSFLWAVELDCAKKHQKFIAPLSLMYASGYVDALELHSFDKQSNILKHVPNSLLPDKFSQTKVIEHMAQNPIPDETWYKSRKICRHEIQFIRIAHYSYFFTTHIPKDAGRLCFHRCLSAGGGGIPQPLVLGPLGGNPNLWSQVLSRGILQLLVPGPFQEVPQLLVPGPFRGRGYTWIST